MVILFKFILLTAGIGFLVYLWHPEFYKKMRRKKSKKRRSNKSLGKYNHQGRISTKKHTAKTKSGKSFWKNIFWGLILIFGLGVLFVVGLFVFYAKELPNPAKINKRLVTESTRIYDRTGEHLLYEIHGEEKRTVVPVEQIPETIKTATVVLEDDIFYSHHGFDMGGIIKATCHEFSSKVGLGDLGGLCPQRGGSTITQQFIKNSILTSERKYSRKIKELILAIEIEQKFSKKEILGMYLNEIPYGSNAYGIEAAAQTFFGVSAKDLTLAQSALLACLPNAPTYYSPHGTHTDRLLNRWNHALNRMVDLDYITSEQAEEARKEDILSQVKPFRDNILAPHFSLYVKEKLVEKFGEEATEKEGFKVFTTLDWDLQQLAEKYVKEGVETEGPRWRFSNAALVAINPKKGDVLAMVGSKDYFDESIDGNVNVATRLRQPGSSFKPYVYAQAFREGYTPDTILFDVPTNFGRDGSGKKYRPVNYDGHYHGGVKVKKALAMSLNVPAVKMLYLVGIKDALNLAGEMGITSLSQKSGKYGLALVLGGGEVKLLDHVSAFGVFANEGERKERRVILRIEKSNGEMLDDYEEEAKGKQVLEKNVARQITEILSDNKLRAAAFGSHNNLVVPGVQVAAKTGTTNEYRDGWLIGATPSLAVGVWAGNNDNKAMKPGAAGVNVAGPIWNKFMIEATKNSQHEFFNKPTKIDTGKDILDGKLKIVDKIDVCKDGKKMCVKDGGCPDGYSKKSKKFFVAHNILYYVDKDDPRGKIPKHPDNDPQYHRWEESLRNWAEEHADGKGRDSIPDKKC